MISEVECIDNMEYMARFPDKYFDLAINDPPYGIGNFISTTSRGKKVKRKFGAVKWNNAVPSKEYFDELIRVSKNRIIWGANYYNVFESGAIVWDKLNNHPDMSRCEIASNSIKRTVDYIQIQYAGFTDKDRCHPCQKPVSLYRTLLTKYATVGDKILDPHLGSQSSRIAADIEGFDFYGCEMDPLHFEDGCKRFNNHIAQATLF